MPLVRVYEPSFVRQVTLEHLEKWPHVCPSCNKIKWEAYHELNQVHSQMMASKTTRQISGTRIHSKLCPGGAGLGSGTFRMK